MNFYTYIYLCSQHTGQDRKHCQHPGASSGGQTRCLCSPSILGRHRCVFLGPQGQAHSKPHPHPSHLPPYPPPPHPTPTGQCFARTLSSFPHPLQGRGHQSHFTGKCCNWSSAESNTPSSPPPETTGLPLTKGGFREILGQRSEKGLSSLPGPGLTG